MISSQLMSGFKHNWNRFVGMALLTLTALFYVACLPKSPVGEDAADFKGGERAGVLAVMASAKEVPLIHRAKGEIVPSNSIKVQAAANGTIEQVMVHEGQKISAGTQLIRFDNEAATARLNFVKAEGDEADAAVDYDQFRFDNRETLLDEEEISATVYDLLEKKLEYEKARAKRAKAEIGYLEKVASNADITSSIAGVVVNRNVADGMPVAEGQFLMEIIQDDPVKLKVSLPEEFIPATHRGQLLQVVYPNNPEEQTVKITEVGVAVDPLTGTFDVFAKLENPDGLLKTGMQLPATLVTEKKTRIISIPKKSVALRDKKTVVFRIDNGVARKTRVRLGQTNGTEVAVKKGVQEGEIIVLSPPPGLKDGDKVDILTAAAENNSKPTAQ